MNTKRVWVVAMALVVATSLAVAGFRGGGGESRWWWSPSRRRWSATRRRRRTAFAGRAPLSRSTALGRIAARRWTPQHAEPRWWWQPAARRRLPAQSVAAGGLAAESLTTLRTPQPGRRRPEARRQSTWRQCPAWRWRLQPARKPSGLGADRPTQHSEPGRRRSAPRDGQPPRAGADRPAWRCAAAGWNW